MYILYVFCLTRFTWHMTDFYLYFIHFCEHVLSSFLGKFSQNTITSCPSATFLLSLSLPSLYIRLLLYPSIRWTRFYIEMRVCVCVCMGIRRKSYDVLPATGPSWFPPLATTLRGVKRRQNATGGGTTGKDERSSEVETRLLFFVLITKISHQFCYNANVVAMQRSVTKNIRCVYL